MRWFITRTGPYSLSPRGPSDRVRCARCADVIGMYEPVIVGDGPDAYRASLFTHPELMSGRERVFHHACAAGSEQNPEAA